MEDLYGHMRDPNVKPVRRPSRLLGREFSVNGGPVGELTDSTLELWDAKFHYEFSCSIKKFGIYGLVVAIA